MSVTFLQGDVLERLATLPDESVHCVVTSPPYWGLRDYGVAGQMGSEPTLTEHLAVMTRVFREVRRVLRSDGTLWLNYGDCYATTPNGRSAAAGRAAGGDDRTFRDKPFSTIGGTLKPKDLCMIPHRLAIALQEDGWWVRSDIVWHKPNPMPSSVKDRPTPAKEYVFLLTKSARYFYDDVAIREASVTAPDSPRNQWNRYDDAVPGQKPQHRLSRVKVPAGWDTGAGAHGSFHHEGRSAPDYRECGVSGTRAKRDVWTIATEPFSGARFATMPTKLVDPCIRAGTSERGVCPHCGAPWVRVVAESYANSTNSTTNGPRNLVNKQFSPGYALRLEKIVSTTGWSPTCGCGGNEPIQATVLDPFGGVGTTGLVADRLGRDAILIEINPQYIAMGRQRIADDAGLFGEVA